jgi:dephospho-CoA kinase
LRDASTHEEAVSRLSSQMPIEEKVAYADVVIDNSSSIHDLEREVNIFVKNLKRKTGGWWWLICWLVPPVGVLAALPVLALRASKRSMTYKRIKKMY